MWSQMSDNLSRPSKSISRRRLLRASGATLGLGVTTGVSGCSSSLPPLGQQQSYGRLDTPAANEPTYTQWIPAPPATDGSDSDAAYYLFGADTPGTTARVPRLLALRRASTICSLDYFGIGWTAYDRYVWTPFGSVLSGDFTVDAVRDTLSETAYTRTGTYQKYHLFERPDGRRVGVSDGVLLFVTPGDEHPNLSRLADAGAGGHPRLRDTDSPGAEAMNTAGTGIRLVGGREFGSFHEQAQWGVETFRAGNDGIYQVITLVFPSERTVALGDVKTAYREQTELRSGWTAGADSFDVDRDGRIVTLAARVPTQNLVEFQEFAAPVQATWGFNWDATTRSLTIRHEAGEPVSATRLTVDIDTDQAPYRLDSREVWAGTRTVMPGDQTTLDLADTPGLRSVSLNLRRTHDAYYWSLARWEPEQTKADTGTV